MRDCADGEIPRQTQQEAILAHLRTGAALTPLEALDRYGCFRLAPRVLELRKLGHDIRTRMETRHGKRWASYYLTQPDLFAPSIPASVGRAVPAGERAGAAL